MARAIPLIVALGCLGVGLPARATSVDLGGGERVRVPVRSFRALRDEGVVRQRTDYSCGAGALATLLRAFGEAVDEPEILGQLLANLARDEEALRKKEGFSLLDLKRVAEQRGHRAQGFRLDPRHLAQLKRPVLVFVRPHGYEHFAVLRGVRGDRVYLADPSLGNVRMPLYRFLGMWRDPEDPEGRGIVFAVEPAGGAWLDQSPLDLPDEAETRPEILATRELLLLGTHRSGRVR